MKNKKTKCPQKPKPRIIQKNLYSSEHSRIIIHHLRKEFIPEGEGQTEKPDNGVQDCEEDFNVNELLGLA